MSTKIRQTPFYVDVDGYRVNGAYSPDVFRQFLKYKPRSDDFFIVTFPKCGTTWTQQIVYLIYNRGKPCKSAMEFFSRTPYPELFGVESLEHMKRPGAIKSHLPFEMMPYSTEAKYLCVIRNPKDTLVSFYHHTKNIMYRFEEGEFDDYFDIFIRGQNDYADYFDNVLSWYNHRNDPNVLVVMYEELKLEKRKTILKIAQFMGDNYAEMLEKDEAVFSDVLKYSDIEYMKKSFNEVLEDHYNNLDNSDVKEQPSTVFPGFKHFQEVTAESERLYKLRKSSENEPLGEQTFRFVRNGQVGEWKITLSTHQNEQLNKKIEERLKGTELYDYWKKNNCI